MSNIKEVSATESMLYYRGLKLKVLPGPNEDL